MLISIVIPAYNYAHSVVRAIESVLAQQDTNIEILIVDDGSTDDTATIIQPYTQRVPYITYSYQANQGLASARNHGTRRTQGDYLLFLDADDALLPGALAAFRSFIQSHPDADVIAAGHTSIEVNGKERVHLGKTLTNNPDDNFAKYIKKKISFSNGALLISRHVAQTLPYPEHLRCNEDIPVCAHMLALFKCMSFPQSVLTVYKHADSLRNQHVLNTQVGLQVVDMIFDPRILPEKLMRFRRKFYARRCLDLFRALYLNQDYTKARKFYWQALVNDPSCIFSFAHFKKWIFSFCR